LEVLINQLGLEVVIHRRKRAKVIYVREKHDAEEMRGAVKTEFPPCCRHHLFQLFLVVHFIWAVATSIINRYVDHEEKINMV